MDVMHGASQCQSVLEGADVAAALGLLPPPRRCDAATANWAAADNPPQLHCAAPIIRCSRQPSSSCC